jgi:uncharacterized protein YecE (DUF72 family)
LYKPLRPLLDSGKLGPVLWQLPATFHRDDERLGGALDALPPGRHAFEFRHASWYVDEVYDLLGRYDVALVVADHRAWSFPTAVGKASWSYVRLHFGHRSRDGNYSRAEIHDWGSRVKSWKRETWVYFNNDWQAFAPSNARDLSELLTHPHAAAA